MARAHSTEETKDKIPDHEFVVQEEQLQIRNGSLVGQVTSDKKPARKGKAYVKKDSNGIEFGVHR